MLIALLVCLIPTTIGGLLSAIGITGMDRLHPAQRARHCPAAPSKPQATSTCCCSTRPAPSRSATAWPATSSPAPGVTAERLADAAQLASLADETPEGRSIVVLAKEKFNLRGRERRRSRTRTFVPFTAQTRMSGVDLPALTASPLHPQRRRRRHEALMSSQLGGTYPACRRRRPSTQFPAQGGTPLVVAEGREVLGVIHLKDVVKGGIKERFAQLRKMGIRTVMITGDNPLTAAAIAAEAGVDDFIAAGHARDETRAHPRRAGRGRTSSP